MTTEPNVQRALELLRDLSLRAGKLGNITVAIDINDIINILSPPPLNKGKQIAKILDLMAVGKHTWGDGLNSIAAILREGDAK